MTTQPPPWPVTMALFSRPHGANWLSVDSLGVMEWHWSRPIANAVYITDGGSTVKRGGLWTSHGRRKIHCYAALQHFAGQDWTELCFDLRGVE